MQMDLLKRQYLQKISQNASTSDKYRTPIESGRQSKRKFIRTKTKSISRFSGLKSIIDFVENDNLPSNSQSLFQILDGKQKFISENKRTPLIKGSSRASRRSRNLSLISNRPKKRQDNYVNSVAKLKTFRRNERQISKDRESVNTFLEDMKTKGMGSTVLKSKDIPWRLRKICRTKIQKVVNGRPIKTFRLTEVPVMKSKSGSQDRYYSNRTKSTRKLNYFNRLQSQIKKNISEKIEKTRRRSKNCSFGAKGINLDASKDIRMAYHHKGGPTIPGISPVHKIPLMNSRGNETQDITIFQTRKTEKEKNRDHLEKHRLLIQVKEEMLDSLKGLNFAHSICCDTTKGLFSMDQKNNIKHIEPNLFNQLKDYGLFGEDYLSIQDKENKYQRVIKNLIMILNEMSELELKVEDLCHEKAYPQTPYSKPVSKQFFLAIKANDLDTVRHILKEDKNYVHDFDYVSQSLQEPSNFLKVFSSF